MRRKWGIGLLIVPALLFYAPAASAQDIRLAVDGREHSISGAQIRDGQLFVPLPQFCRALGLEIHKYAGDERLYLSGDGMAVSLEIVPGRDYVGKGGVEVPLSRGAVKHGNQVYVPLRPLAELLDYQVTYRQGVVTLSFPTARAAPVEYPDHEGRRWDIYLRQPLITSMAADDLYYWAGTATGGILRITRSNPQEMVQFTTFNSDLPDSRIRLVETTPDGTKWALTGAGLVRFSGGESGFETVGDPYEPRECLVTTAPDGAKWLYDGRLAHLTGDGEAVFADTPEKIVSMAVDRDGVLWVIGESGKAYSRTEDGGFKECTALNPYIDRNHGGRIERVFVDSDGTKWFVLFLDFCPPESWHPFMIQRRLLHLLPDGQVEVIGEEQGVDRNWWIAGFVPQPNGDKLLLVTERVSLDATRDYLVTLDGRRKALKDKQEYGHSANANGQRYLVSRDSGYFCCLEEGRKPLVFKCNAKTFRYGGKAFFLDGWLWFAERDALYRIDREGKAQKFSHPQNYIFGPVVKVERKDGAHRFFVCSPAGSDNDSRIVILTGDGHLVCTNNWFGGNFFYREGIDHHTLYNKQREMSDRLGGNVWVEDVIYELEGDYQYMLCNDTETSRGYIVAVDGQDNVIRSENDLPDLGRSRIFYIDPEGGTWAVFQDGVLKFSIAGGRLTTEQVVLSPLEGGVNYMLLDGDSLWLATDGGVARTVIAGDCPV
ncbi:MAG: copper amine oxidase N-terminal domain-containing protein [Thermoanaerobacterales bacterium]|nr:copper amine oxidase N-terminal domain-containing protein [Thermoanaerobacterales bacterium]